MGESRVSSEKRGDLCGIGGFQGKNNHIPNEYERESKLARGFLRGKKPSVGSMLILAGVPWVQRNLAW